MKNLIILMVIAGYLQLAPVLAQNRPDTATVNFVQKAAKGGLMEVASGKLAASKAGNGRVRDFGLRMVQDHSKANEQLKTVATAKSIALPAAPPEDQMLNQAKGADFDRNYVQMMVKDHEEDVAMFQQAANSLPDPEVKAFAARTLPILKEHLAMIKKIASDLNYH
jgi:putative membrane protein